MTGFPLHYRDGGWFGAIGDSLTYSTVDHFARTMAAHVLRRSSPAAPRPRAVVSYDQRFLAERFAERMALSLEASGLSAELSQRALPTAALSRAVLDRRAAVGVHLSGRGADAEWGGIVWRTEAGAPPSRERAAKFRAELDEAASQSADADGPANGNGGNGPNGNGNGSGGTPSVANATNGAAAMAPAMAVPRSDFFTPWLEQLCTRVEFDLIRRVHPFAIAVDAMHGVARRHIERLLADTQVTVHSVRPDADPTFGGTPPDPWHPGALAPLRRSIAHHGCAWGVAFNGDGTRALFLDSSGELISPSLIFALLAEYLVETRNLRGPAIRSWSTDPIIEAALRDRRRHTFEVAPGLLSLATSLAANGGLAAGDHDGHLLFGGYLNDSDPFLATHLLVEMTARSGIPLEGAIADLQRRHWPVHTGHHEFAAPADALRQRMTRLTDLPPERVGSREVHRTVATEGLRLMLRDGSWVMLRLELGDTLACLDVGAQSRASADSLLRDSVELLLGRPIPQVAAR